MFEWLKRATETADRDKAAALYAAVRAALADHDATHVRIVGSVAALLLCVAYADLRYDPAEERLVRDTLARMQGLDPAGVDAVVGVLRRHTVDITAAEATSYARELLELTDEDFRVELLDLLVDVAAADDDISLPEVNMLRGIVKALGLSQAHYNDSQARHRDKLAVLRRG
jgi:uncharacterized tellurite resistance protein B-like protein